MTAATSRAEAEAAEALARFLRRHERLLVLTGAGCSTGSGIPAYRDEDGNWMAGQPVLYQDFVSRPKARRRYWSRSINGWPRFARAAPGPAHVALAELQERRRLTGLLTQNVDGLHQRAGQRDVVELHGNLGGVVCLGCRRRVARDAVQQRLEADNPDFAAVDPKRLLPDGDAATPAGDLAAFRVPDCERCGGVLKPDVVFFGESAPGERVARGMEAVAEADALLVVGTSLMLLSGLRFCRRAVELGRPIAAVNRGRTRADALFALKVEADCGAVLHHALQSL